MKNQKTFMTALLSLFKIIILLFFNRWKIPKVCQKLVKQNVMEWPSIRAVNRNKTYRTAKPN